MQGMWCYSCVILLMALYLERCSTLGFSFFEHVTGVIGLTEYCNDKWVPANITGVEDDLRHIYGQPFLKSALIPLLRKHYSTEIENKKALALSFHGSPGTGKNFVTELIVRNIFRNGYNSRFFHFYSGMADFSTQADINIYKDKLRKDIEESLALCERSVFVFDEIDKAAEGVVDAIKPFLDFVTKRGGINYSNALYIFLSNVGESHIIDKNVALWKSSIPREEFKLVDFQKILFAAAFNERGGLKYSLAVRNALIDLYLPFLPLEREHVEKCVEVESIRQKFSPDKKFIREIVEELEFGPAPEEIFASHGCKQIESKVVLKIPSEDNFKFDDEL